VDQGSVPIDLPLEVQHAQAIEAVQKELPATPEITQILEFIQGSERGIIR
jgi:acyl-[acyl carrier protein]--UDP-N-acetylglucosamine O-acyltransferase